MTPASPDTSARRRCKPRLIQDFSLLEEFVHSNRCRSLGAEAGKRILRPEPLALNLPSEGLTSARGEHDSRL